jgi:dTMP kinase
MTRAEQPKVVDPTCGATDEALAADSRARATRALLRVPALRRLWEAQFTGAVGDALATLVLVLLTVQAAASAEVFGGGERGVLLALALLFATRIAATVLAGALLLGPIAKLLTASGPLDRRWTMAGVDAFRAAVLIVAPLWFDWVPDAAYVYLLVTVFLLGVAERGWAIARDSAAPALLPAPPPEGAAVRPLPSHHEALRRLWLRSTFVALPVAAAVLVAAALLSNLLATGIDWFGTHQAALGSYVAAGLFAASVSALYFLRLPDADTARPRSPLEGLRRPSAGTTPDRGRTGAIPMLVTGCAALAAAVAAAVSLAVLHAVYLGGGPVYFGLLVLGLTGGATAGIRWAPAVLPALTRRRLLAVSIALTGLGLFAVGMVADPATVLLCALLTGVAAGVAARTGHVLLDQETEEFRRPRLTQHLHAVLRVAIGLAVIAAPVVAGLIGAHRVQRGDFVIDHSGAAYTLMIIGALLLPVAALLLRSADDRRGVPLRRDLKDALHAPEPSEAASGSGFFIAVEGGDGAGKSTQVEALAEWIRGKGHEVVVTREPGATAVGQRLRSILLDVSSEGLSHRAEALLYAADRAEHVDSVVRPALARGAVVISDRYIDSSVAYQGAGRDLSATEIARMSRWATDGLVPQLTILLDVSPETARERFTEAPDRLESESHEFHQRVRAGFLALAAADPARYLVIDAGQDPETVTTAARHRLDQVLPLSEAEVRAQEEARRKAEEEARRRAEEERKRREEEERRERERQEELARLRAEEEERLRREAEEARRVEEERRKAEEERLRREAEEARRAEEARQVEEARRRAAEARQKAEEERLRREAEERARQAEQARLRAQAEEEARLRAQAEERRREKQRKAEEALVRAEHARLAAQAAEAERARREAEEETTVLPAVAPERDPAEDETTVLPQIGATRDPAEDETTVLPQIGAHPDAAETAQLPQIEEGEAAAHGRRPWAEETPLDDVPTLSDELLGPREYVEPEDRDGEDDGESGRRRRR